ncbi:MAG: hypothetical protein KDI48_18695 [Xanthomonadales bacterium]|nr:hypothetical protein [Xanthomonadales bacterium]
MDPTTAFIIAALMMLLNGAVLGLLHGDLPRTLRPAATLWRIGTVLIALGCVALALQRWLPIDLLLPLANGLVVTGARPCSIASTRAWAAPTTAAASPPSRSPR